MKATNINPTASVHLRRMSVTDQQGKTTDFSHSAKSINNDSTQHPQVNTDKKTVHLKDIQNLKKSISTALTQIKSDIKLMMDSNTPSWKKDTGSIKSQLSTLASSIKTYQDKLDSSSYEHHSSKQKNLTKLNNSLSDVNSQIQKIDGKIQKNHKDNDRMSEENTIKSQNLLNGKKAPSKFND